MTGTTGQRSFGTALDAAAAIAALSPSSHNSQPWALAWLTSPGARRSAGALLGLDGDGREYLALALDRDRQLGALPAHATEMLVSCGAYWQVLLDGLAAAGWVAEGFSRAAAALVDDRPPCEGWPAAWSPLAVAAFRRDGASGVDLAELQAVAATRRTNRSAYEGAAVDPELLGRLARGCHRPGAPGAEVEVRHLISPDERATFGRLVAQHAGRDYSHGPAWRETHSFLRWSRREAAERGDGMIPGEPVGRLAGIRQLASRLALAPVSMRVLRHAGYADVLAGRLAATVRSTPVIVTMSIRAPEPDQRSALGAGGRLIEYWLAATRAGLALHPISVLVQHEDVCRQLEDRLGLSRSVFFVSRLGRPTVDAPPSPRRHSAAGYRIL